jgi:hypothetical protein
MTMPHLMNCSHLDDGWCLKCVKKLWNEKESMARRALSAEERLEKAVEALKEAEAGLEFAGAESMKDVGTFVKSPKKALLFVRGVLSELGTPKEFRPPVECAPSVGTDALRDEEQFGDGNPADYGDN